MIVSNIPPPSRFWTKKQYNEYNRYLTDKKAVLAYYLTDKNGYPLYSPNKKRWKARPNLFQQIKTEKIIACSDKALHATMNIDPWMQAGCKIWVVAMLNKIVDCKYKIASNKRK